MEITPTLIPAVKVIAPRRHGDDRGFFSEVWRDDALKAGGIPVAWVQDNHSLSRARGVVRGLHFQTGPSAQAKLVRCTRGAILDVAVDIRRGSPTFGRHVALELSAENWRELVRRALGHVVEARLPFLSAGVAFFAVLSVAPVLECHESM